MIHRAIRSLGLLAFVVTIAAIGSGCSLLGVAASKAGRTVVKPSYTGLAGQSVGVMVAADPGTRNDFRRIQLDIAESLTNKLKVTQNNKADELKGTTFPRNAAPDAIYAFQRNYPQLEWEPINNVAPKLGVTRLIYVEVDGLSLHPNNVPELFRGDITARVQVIEVTGNTAKSAYDERISATDARDPNSPGRLNAGSQATYLQTIDAFSAEVIKRFVSYDAP
jgi:hypothetical protein